MRLDKFRLEREDDKCFYLADDKGPVTVAKKGLGKALIGKIQRHFKGGEVKGYAVGGQIPEMVADTVETGMPTYAEMKRLAAPVEQPIYGPPLLSADQDPAMRIAEPLEQQAVRYQAELDAQQPAPKPEPTVPLPSMDQMLAQQPKPIPQPTYGGGGQNAAEVTRAFKEAQAAEKQKADIAAREAAAVAQAQADAEQRRQSVVDDWAKKKETWTQRGQQLFDDVASHKIDPNRLWNSRSGGQKAGAAIAMILGGIGAGLTRGPNYALDVIDGAINRDIDAQKSELGKKQNLLSFHMQQGHDLDQARQLAMADLKDAAAAQLAAASNRFGGEKAQAAAQANIAQLRQSAAVTRENIAGAGLDRQLKGMQIQMAQEQIKQQRDAIEAQKALTAAIQSGQPIPGGLEALPQPIRERAVQMPNGSIRLAVNEKSANDVRASQAVASELKAAIDDMRKFREKTHGKILPAWASSEAELGKGLRDSVITKLNTLAKLGALSDHDAEKLYSQIPDVNSWVSGDTGIKERLASLDTQIDSYVSSQLNASTSGPKIPLRLTERKAGE